MQHDAPVREPWPGSTRPTLSTTWKLQPRGAQVPRPEEAATQKTSGKLVLSALTSNAIEHILAFLSADEINLLLRTSRGLHSLCVDEGLWSGLCLRKYGEAGEQTLLKYGLRSFSALFAVLSAFMPMQGVYTTLEDYPYGTVMVVRFDGGGLIAESFTPDSNGACARLFEIRFRHDGPSDPIRAVAKCFHHHRPGSHPGRIVGRAAEVRHVPRPGCPIPATGYFAAQVACCSELVLGSAGKGVLEVVFAKGEDQNIYGTWFTAAPGGDMWGGGGEDEDVSEEDAGLSLVQGTPCKSLAEALNRGTRLLRALARLSRPRSAHGPHLPAFSRVGNT